MWTLLYKALLLSCLSLLLNLSQAFKITKKSRQDNPCQGFSMGEFAPNPVDCTHFYWCGENGEAVDAACPPNMLYNAESKLCDVAANVKCVQVAATTTATTTTLPAATQPLPDLSASTSAEYYCATLYNQQPDANSLVFLAHPSNCQRYYMCFHGHALLQECSAQLHWNSKISKCDMPDRAQCNSELDQLESSPNSGLTTGANDASFTIDGVTCPAYGQNIFPHMERCDFFIYCVKGIAILQKCPFYHYFDVELGKCQWRTRALCIKDLNLNYFRKKLNKNF